MNSPQQLMSVINECFYQIVVNYTSVKYSALISRSRKLWNSVRGEERIATGAEQGEKIAFEERCIDAMMRLTFAVSCCGSVRIKQDQSSISPLNPSPDSELYWSPWLYSDIVIPDHPSGSSALTCSLPPFPHCPGPLLASDPPPVHRPDMSFAFGQEHPQLASIYQSVQAVGAPNYRGARQPVPHNLNIQAWRDRSHLFPDASLVEMLEFGFPIGYTAPQLHTLRPSTQATILQPTSFQQT